jgi:hypothetical protein
VRLDGPPVRKKRLPLPAADEESWDALVGKRLLLHLLMFLLFWWSLLFLILQMNLTHRLTGKIGSMAQNAFALCLMTPPALLSLFSTREITSNTARSPFRCCLDILTLHSLLLLFHPFVFLHLMLLFSIVVFNLSSPQSTLLISLHRPFYIYKQENVHVSTIVNREGEQA